MSGIMDTFIKASSTKLDIKRYQSHKFCYDTQENSVIEYDADKEVEWENKGETDNIKQARNLSDKVEQLKSTNQESWFKYFLDGSRHTYKVDDISIGRDVYPILAGQVGISCCGRKNKRMYREKFERKLVLSIPTRAITKENYKEKEAKLICEKINQSENLKKRNLEIGEILLYKIDGDDKLDKKGIAKIQDYMIEQEKKSVMELVDAGKLNKNSFLIKDGSLEYKATQNNHMNLTEAKMKNAFQYVIGVSKSFNPALCKVKGGGTNSRIVANLKENERTPACCYKSEISGSGVTFCVWYLRLRDSKYTQNVFDGVVKVEKLVQENEKKNGVNSELIDTISAFLLLERNPVAYGKDSRWANHLYPVYVTESFAKSKYMANDTFLKLF